MVSSEPVNLYIPVSFAGFLYSCVLLGTEVEKHKLQNDYTVTLIWSLFFVFIYFLKHFRQHAFKLRLILVFSSVIQLLNYLWSQYYKQCNHNGT